MTRTPPPPQPASQKARAKARAARRGASARRGAPPVSPATRQHDRALAAKHRAATDALRSSRGRQSARGLGSERLTANPVESLAVRGGDPGSRLRGEDAGPRPAYGTTEKRSLDAASEGWRLDASQSHERKARAAVALIAGGEGLAQRAAQLDDLVRWLGTLSPEVADGLPANRVHRCPGSPASLALWHATRARTLRRPFLDRAAECGEKTITGAVDLGCGACGEVYAIPVGCGLRSWCVTCSRKYRSSTRKRLARGLGSAQRSALARWNAAGKRRGERPALTLVTFTVRHSGDLAHDRATIYAGIRGLGKRLWHLDGGAAPYVCAWELTPGNDQLGHVHAHVACVWPRRDFKALDAAWAELTHGAGTCVDVVGPGKAARAARARGETRSASAGHAASYLAAYVDAGGMSSTVPAELGARWLGVMRGKRTWHASRGLTRPLEKTAWTPCCSAFAICLGFHRDPADLTCSEAPRGPPA